MEKLFYYNICSGCYMGYVRALDKNDAQVKLIQGFSKVKALQLGNDIEITELEDINDQWNKGGNAKTEYEDRKMLYEEYGIFYK
jgi:hypothetical protein